MASSEKTLKLEVATLEDVSAITDLWFAAFTDPGPRYLWPDTSGVHQWLEDAHRSDLQNKHFQRYIKIVDPQSADSQGRPRIVAFAKWDTSNLDDRGRRYPPWHEDMPGAACEAFFQRADDERRRVMGDRKHYYLDTLGTHPDYQRQGLGSMLVKWGCELADQDGVGVYVDASTAGASLYRKFGFVDESLPDAGDFASMARR
ncbi:acetyltransferase [Penicillium macrosclerotiorum]|uniref:acetyltransferase n=1 Tax=Penicillium macrosclerotiorum TaxID=303699 RepID=UPI002546C976|nr:acetyltransferase [Penicillium macrosclerotiorum]KAJ5690846.1 acetyltransferase [Penicillium macrosclerotiorum]